MLRTIDPGSACRLSVFRSTRERVSPSRLLAELRADASGGRTVDALVRAGEIESALADAHSPLAAPSAALTDALAARLLDAEDIDVDFDARATRLAGDLRGAPEVTVSPPEAFSYYGLDPRDFAAPAIAPWSGRPPDHAVIGVRGIGSTLSAVVQAALRARGARAERRTARPAGHPYDRVLHLSPEDVAWVREQAARAARFVVVDEGPGMSGSTLLATVDALVNASVPSGDVTVLCTRHPDPRTLLARDGARRWGSLRVAVAAGSPRVPGEFVPLAPGAWRPMFLGPDRGQWPPCWNWLERVKAISRDGRTIRKFEGLGRYGAAAAARARAVAEAGFGPRVRDAGDGRLEYDVAPGTPDHPGSLDERAIDRLAGYCAFRATRFPASESNPAIAEMMRVNADVALGVAVRSAPRTERPVIPDGHMMPHEWIRARDGTLLKTDASSHGDDHLFPGPADIAWDLAGAVVEWRMPRAAVDRLLARYERLSGDAARARLPEWLLAYALHRLAWSALAAANATRGDGEGERLAAEARAKLRWMREASGRGLLGREAASIDAATCGDGRRARRAPPRSPS